jgi:SAM-dependent methyltransferase
MIKEAQLFYYNQGNKYFKIRGKYNIVIDLMKKFCSGNINPSNKESKILDIGSGPGNMLDFMKSFGDVYGNDTSSDAKDFLKNRNLEFIDGDITKEEIAQENSFSVITMIDSLEHMDNDLEVLKSVKKILKPSGQVVITVPAYNFLWGVHDEKYGHFRRYRKKEIKKKLISSGFIINKISYSEPLILPLLILYRIIKKVKKSKRDDYVELPAWLNGLLLWIITTEKYYLRYFNFCFGATIIAIAEKPK